MLNEIKDNLSPRLPQDAPFKLLFGFVKIVVVSLVFTIALPGAIALFTKTAAKSYLRDKIPPTFPTLKNQLDHHDAIVKSLCEKIKQQDDLIQRRDNIYTAIQISKRLREEVEKGDKADLSVFKEKIDQLKDSLKKPSETINKIHQLLEGKALDANHLNSDSKTKLFETLKQLDDLFRQLPTPSDLSMTIDLRKKLREELEKVEAAKPPISLLPFLWNITALLWPVIYISLLTIICLAYPPIKKPTSEEWQKVFIIGVVVFVISRAPNWIRNLANFWTCDDETRKVFSYANADIDPFSFGYQELMALGYCLMFSLIWQVWLAYFAKLRKRQMKRLGELELADLDAFRQEVFTSANTERLSNIFLHWQVVTLILTLGILPYTANFWSLINGSGDQRYIASAVIIHAIWGLTLVIISLPLLTEWHHWYVLRLRLVNKLATTEHQDKTDHILTLMEKSQPIPLWNLIGSSVLALVAFLIPIIQAIAK